MLDDVEQSLTGVSASLGLDEQGLAQACLHARDLAQALGSAGSEPLARLVDDIAQRLSQGEVQALFLAKGLAPLVAQWLEQARQGQVADAATLGHIEHWQQRLAERPALALSDQAPADDLAPPAGRPLLPRELDAAHLHAAGLADLARMRGELHASLFSPQALDVHLSAFEDRLVSLGQYALSDIYMGPTHHVQHAWADHTLMDFFKGSLNWALRAHALRAATSQLTVRMDWLGAELNDSEAQALGRQVAGLQGQAQRLPEGGWRLWLPASRLRMRVQTFTQDGQAFALSAALLAQPPAAHDRQLKLRVGLTESTLPVDAVGRQAPMNLHAIPACVPVPKRVSGVAVDPTGALYPMLRLVEQTP